MAATQMALPSGERRTDPSLVVYGVLTLSVAVFVAMGALCAAYLAIRQGTGVWPPKGIINQEYFDNTLGATAVIGVIAGWWGLFGIRHAERRQAVLGFGLSIFMQGAVINLLTYSLRSSHLSARSNAYGVLVYALATTVIAVFATGIAVGAVALIRTLGGQVTREEPGLGWACAWYGTVVCGAYLVMYFLVHVVQ